MLNITFQRALAVLILVMAAGYLMIDFTLGRAAVAAVCLFHPVVVLGPLVSRRLAASFQ